MCKATEDPPTVATEKTREKSLANQFEARRIKNKAIRERKFTRIQAYIPVRILAHRGKFDLNKLSSVLILVHHYTH